MNINESFNWTPFIYHFAVGGAIFATGITLYYVNREKHLKEDNFPTPVIMCVLAMLLYLVGTFIWQWLAMQGPGGR